MSSFSGEVVDPDGVIKLVGDALMPW